MDNRNQVLAHNLINYSVRLKKGEKLLIELIDEGMELAQALIKEAYKVGGVPFLTIKISECSVNCCWVQRKSRWNSVLNTKLYV